MRKLMVAVYDSALQAYATPIVVPSRGVAVRSFSDEVNRNAENNPLYAHPTDFELRILAEWDEETGIFYALADGGPATIARGADVHRKE